MSRARRWPPPGVWIGEPHDHASFARFGQLFYGLVGDVFAAVPTPVTLREAIAIALETIRHDLAAAHLRTAWLTYGLGLTAWMSGRLEVWDA
jgi:hypothetical protein